MSPNSFFLLVMVMSTLSFVMGMLGFMTFLLVMREIRLNQQLRIVPAMQPIVPQSLVSAETKPIPTMRNMQPTVVSKAVATGFSRERYIQAHKNIQKTVDLQVVPDVPLPTAEEIRKMIQRLLKDDESKKVG